jgi:hypothetical protein
MAGHARLLKVPYFAQPTDTTCQATVLKMYASYLDNAVLLRSSAASEADPVAIKHTINADPRRPNKKLTNAHANMKWWLEDHYPTLTFQYVTTNDEAKAIETVVQSIDRGFPVLVAVSHAKVAGHIILAVGYEGYVPFSSTADFRLVVHDPYGAFDPSLLSKAYGKRRWQGGVSLQSGGEIGPGTAVRLAPEGVSRHKVGDAARGWYYMIFATR